MNHMNNNNNIDRKHEKQKTETQAQFKMCLNSLKIKHYREF